MPWSQIFNVPNMSFNVPNMSFNVPNMSFKAICENKILTKISEFTESRCPINSLSLHHNSILDVRGVKVRTRLHVYAGLFEPTVVTNQYATNTKTLCAGLFVFLSHVLQRYLSQKLKFHTL